MRASTQTPATTRRIVVLFDFMAMYDPQVTQVDLVQSQIRIAAGATLKELGLVQKNIKVSGVAMQCRVTTEDPSQVP